MANDTQPIADFFDRECCAAVDAGASPMPGSRGVTSVLLAELEAAGMTGLTVLELGSGAGALSRELLARGATRVTGVDLSPVSVEHAATEATAAGLADQLRYVAGDAAQARFEAHDAVVSQKVFCCYPNPDRLLTNTLPAARRVYALVLPESRGVIGRLARVVVAVENAVQWIRRDPFQAYVHDVRRIDERLRAAGFERRADRRHWAWLVLVYERMNA